MNPREGPQGAKALSDPEGLALDISRLELDRDSADMVFVVGREEARVSGHAAIFNVRCSKFVELVSNHTEENPQPGSITVRLGFLGNEAFLMFVHFVYSGRADVTQVNLLELLAIAGLFGVPSLVRHCQSQLKSSLSRQTAQSLLNDAAVVAPEAGDRQALARPLLQYVAENIVQLRESQALDMLTKDGLILLVSSGALHAAIPESEIWRLCLRWARLQAGSELTSSPRSWGEEERSRIRLALEGVVQHIRLLQIDSNVFAEEVEPTGAVPMELSLERYRLAALPDKFQHGMRMGDGRANSGQDRVPPPVASRPGRQPQEQQHHRLNLRAEVGGHEAPRERGSGGSKRFSCSRILTGLAQSAPNVDCAKLLNSWTGQAHSQTWRCVFRASEHNFSASVFHTECNAAGPSIVVLRSNMGCVSGGFTDVPWSLAPSGKGRYLASESSFLFTLANLAGLPPTRFEIKKKLFAVSHHPDCGPVFGAGADLFICDSADSVGDSYSNLPHSYDGSGATSSLLLGDYNATLSEYEVLVPSDSS